MIQNLKSNKEKIDNKHDKEDKILARLRRVEGQMGGIIKMYEKRKGCFDIVQQIVAVRAALGGVAKILLRDEAVKCARRPGENFEKTLENLLKFT